MLSRNRPGAPHTEMPPADGLKVWLNSSHLLGIAGLLTAIVLVLSLSFIRMERGDREFESLQQFQQLAKVLARQTATDLGAVESMLLVLANAERDLRDPQQESRIEPLVGSMVRGYPQLRSLSVLNEEGQVLASTSLGNLGLQVDMGIFGVLPLSASKVATGRVLAGRDLADIERRVPMTPKFNVLPMLVRQSGIGSQQLILLALVNADYFSSVYEASINDPMVRVALVGYEGELLIATSQVTRPLGSSLSQLQLFEQYLPAREWGSYVGVGLDHENVSTAFSVLPKWPMAVVVESSMPDVMSDVTRVERWTLVLTLAVLLVILALTMVTTRSLSRHVSNNERLYQAVRHSEARQRAMFDSSIDGILTADAQGRILSFNKAAETMFVRSSANVVGKPIHELLVPLHLRQDHQAGMQRYLATGDGPVSERLSRRIETTAMRSDGNTFPIELTIVSSVVNGRVFFTAIAREISERVRIEAERADLLLKYRELMSDLASQKMALDQHAIVSIEEVDGTITYANDKLVQISGFSKDELLGKKYYQFRERLNPVAYAEMRSALSVGWVWHGELSLRRKDGGNYWVANTTVPVANHDGTIRNLITIQTDITQLRKAEIALAQASQRELEIGSRIQQSLLAAGPQHATGAIWLSSFNQASKGIDGDFIEVIQIGEHCIDIIAGDVMGKGVPAALMGAATKLQFSRSMAELLAQRHTGQEAPEPIAIMSSVHQAMTPHLLGLEAFVTLCYIRVDRQNKSITWVGCGHEEALLIHADGRTLLLPNQHPPLGVLQSVEYTQDVTPLLAGDALFLCSDGLADAVLPNQERVGRGLINQTIQRLAHTHGTPAAILHSLRAELLHDQVAVNDDVTLVMVTLPSDAQDKARCELAIDMTSLRALRDFVTTQASRSGMSEADVAIFEVASVEVFTNIVRHGQGLLASAPLELVAYCVRQEFVLEVIYLGDAFTPPDEIPETNFDVFPEGGFGLTIIRNACDRIEYLQNQGVNTVRMGRYVEA